MGFENISFRFQQKITKRLLQQFLMKLMDHLRTGLQMKLNKQLQYLLGKLEP
ncbi:MAG: hypothetical protein R2874_12645 [Desulfobacterales bacterium]